MALGPLEYLIIGCPGNHFTSEVVPELHAIQEKELIQVVDLLFLRKDTHGTVTVLEVKDLDADEVAALGNLKNSLMGLITHEDILTLSTSIPPDTSAVVVLLEHRWIRGLEKAIEQASGQVFVSGMVPHHAHTQLEQELEGVQSRMQNSGQPQKS